MADATLCVMFVLLPRARRRGFTLTELMIVVALVGTLAAIGVASFRSELSASKSTEAASVVQAVRAAQETYRAENQRYLSVSGSGNSWYPNANFNGTAYAWALKENSHPDQRRWQRLGPAVTQPVVFRYLVHAGVPGQPLPTLQAPVSLGTPAEAWFVIQARADADKNGIYCDAVATSWSNELYIKNEGE